MLDPVILVDVCDDTTLERAMSVCHPSERCWEGEEKDEERESEGSSPIVLDPALVARV